jgi:hypothetical protein
MLRFMFTRGDTGHSIKPNGAAHPRSNQAPVRTDKRKITGPYSRLIDRGALGCIDGNSREGKYLRAYERALVEHVGGRPSATQRALITRTARLALHLELLDERSIVEGKGLSATDCHFYCVWSNSLSRHLAKLGFEPSAPAQAKAKPRLADTLAEIAWHDG